MREGWPMVKKWEDWGVGDSCRMERERERKGERLRKKGPRGKGREESIGDIACTKGKGYAFRGEQNLEGIDVSCCGCWS